MVFWNNIKGQVYPKIKLHFYSFPFICIALYNHLDYFGLPATERYQKIYILEKLYNVFFQKTQPNYSDIFVSSFM